MDARKVCVIDVGTNSVRMMVARASAQRIQEVLFTEGRITRLGEGLRQTGMIGPGPLERTVRVLNDFLERARAFAPERLRIVTTSAVRQSSNQAEVVREVLERTGVPIDVIDGETEARLTYLGALQDMEGLTPPYLVLDIGGGSTELIFGESRQECLKAFSIEVGVVTLTEGFLKGNPPSGQEISEAESFVRKTLQPVFSHLLPYVTSSITTVGTAGSVTTLLAMALGMKVYNPALIHRKGLSRGTVQDLFDELARKSLEERLRIPGVEKGREDIIFAGALILLSVMRSLSQAGLVVSDSGLREGVLLQAAGETVP
ncbi:MAG: Ppx/GppA family phosphatase [Nitrospirae bacterium]|nr:Ppx/GppA family phosphatase [Nitrospirota bacterium]